MLASTPAFFYAYSLRAETGPHLLTIILKGCTSWLKQKKAIASISFLNAQKHAKRAHRHHATLFPKIAATRPIVWKSKNTTLSCGVIRFTKKSVNGLNASRSLFKAHVCRKGSEKCRRSRRHFSFIKLNGRYRYNLGSAQLQRHQTLR